MRPWRIGTALVTAGSLAVVFACGGPLRQDELDCEEAVAVLEGCCPGFVGSLLECQYTSDCGGTRYPAIPEDQASCIRRESCDELKSTGVCQRAQEAREYGTTTSASSANAISASPAQVCP